MKGLVDDKEAVYAAARMPQAIVDEYLEAPRRRQAHRGCPVRC